VGSWPSLATGTGAMAGLTAMLLPVAMWFAGISVAIFGLQRLVLRHISDMRSAMRRFALGERGEGLLALQDPPLEMEELERAFNRMALIVTDAEARSEADLQDKEVLLKEVHHRVKNNLQLIASIMNLQIRRAHSPEAKRLLTGLQRRVRGLAMLHRSLYTTPDMTTIDSRDLISTVVQDASSLLPDRKQRVETELASIELYPDQAVPLSMLIAEALTNAFKYGDAGSDEPIRVKLEQLDGERARLVFTNPVQPGVETITTEGDGLGTQLMTAFVRQLEGESRSGIEDGRYVFEASFARRGFETMSAA
jgi:two-component sensor histidine kinase